MEKDRLLFLVDEESRLRTIRTSLIQSKWRLINIIGDNDICMELIDVVEALNKVTSEYNAVYSELQNMIEEIKNEEK